MSMEGKVCIVTGASSGIGAAISILLAERKALLVLCGRSKTRLENTATKCENIAGQGSKSIVTVIGDLKLSEVRHTIVKKAVEAFGRVDVLVANAGILGLPVSLEDATEDVYDDVMAMDVKSVFFLIQAALPWLEASKGSIVCMSSTSSVISGDAVIYHMAKASIDHMCRCLSVDLGPKGIRINSVNPTFVQTRLLRSVVPHLEEDDSDTITPDPFTQSKNGLHPLHGRCADVNEVARVVAFLAGNEASFVTGQNLFVDGGISRTCLAFQKE